MRYGKFVSAVYIINVVVQSFFSLAFPMGLGLLGAWLLVEKAGAPTFFYPIFIVLGALIGLYSMIKSVLEAMTAVERLEKEREQKKQERNSNQKKDISDENEK